MSDENSLRILDITDLDFDDSIRVEKLINQLSGSCERNGFFMLKVGGKEFGEICLKMLTEAKKIFKLPPEEKEKLINDGKSQMHHRGI